MGAQVNIVVSGVPAYNGTYPLDFDHLTNRDYQIIKRIADVTQPEMVDAFQRGDTNLGVAWVVCALRRRHGTVIEELLWEAPPGAFEMIGIDDADGDDIPPTSAPAGETGSMPSGAPLNGDSAHHPDPSHPDTGPASSDSSVSAPSISTS